MNTAIILAAGKGDRFGSPIPKQFMVLGGKPVIEHTLDVFYYHMDIAMICVVCPRGYCKELEEKYAGLYPAKKIIVTEGGTSRQESTLMGLRAVKSLMADDDIVIIHDSVRPFVSPRIVSENIAAASTHGAVDTVIPSHDTIVDSQDGSWATSIPERKRLFLGQTPQTFRYGLICDALDGLTLDELSAVTDEVTLVLRRLLRVNLVMGEKTNFKITTSWDLELAEALLTRRHL